MLFEFSCFEIQIKFRNFAVMKLSILIPAYNQSCLRLVNDLKQQCEQEGLDYEILVADDGSSDIEAKQKNKEVGNILHCRALMSEKNTGRAATRNKLVRESQGDYLLFVDSDAEVISEDFIHLYLAECPTEAVICGGIRHPETLPSPEVSLRYLYEKSCESRFTADKCNRHPYQCLRSFNFMMPRTVALQFPFNEKIRTYGHEDTLMGKAFESGGINVRHIDNPLMNSDIEDNATFLEKTKESMQTLFQIEEEMKNYSSLLTLYYRIKKFHLTPLVSCTYRLFRKPIERNLLSKRPCVKLLQFYKLGYYTSLVRTAFQPQSGR